LPIFYDNYKQQATSKNNYYQDPVELYWHHQYSKRITKGPGELAESLFTASKNN